MKVKDLHSTLIMIFRPDELPYGVLSRDDTADRLGVRYSLTQERPPFSIPGTQPNLVYVNGKSDTDEKPVLIDRLVVEARRILLTVSADTASARRVFEDLKVFIGEVELRDTDYEYAPVSLTFETQSTTEMSIDFVDIFKGSALPNINDHLSITLPNHGSEIDIYPTSVRFRVGYRNPPAVLSRSRINLVDKYLVLEVKDKTEPSDRIMQSVSPADSETHLKLLTDIEQLVRQR